MAYQHESYVFGMGQTPQQGMYFHPQLQQPAFIPQPSHHDMMLAYRSYSDGFETMPTSLYVEDFDDSNEVSTRPRLTKDQVDVLETEFQKNPKPNSMLKRQLAVHTSLSLNRVANWFQNRRAKAKQQRKQEEYETSQQQNSTQSKQDSVSLSAEDDDEDEEEFREEEEDKYISSTNDTAQTSSTKQSPSRSPDKGQARDDVREKGWLSLQRALAAANAARAIQHEPSSHQLHEQVIEMPPPLQPAHVASHLKTSPQPQAPTRPQPRPHQIDWSAQPVQQHWSTSPPAASDMTFDFGFNSSEQCVQQDGVHMPSPTDSGSHSGVLSPGTWESSLITPTMPPPNSQYQQPLQSPGLPTPTYSSSRRGSIADTLTNNFEGFAIANSTLAMGFPTTGSVSSEASDTGTDLASRRRRQRPADLKSASLRSRSYGALTAASPTFRQGIPSASAHALRHSKSTGHGLNSYGGIRKSSFPQKSPLNVSTFAEADFQQLMARKAAENSMKQQLTPINTTPMSFPSSQAQSYHSLHQMVHTEVPLQKRSQMQSPPITPYQTDFMLHSASMMPPGIQAQYASFADFTPPYSAGPLTNSSWSDAPLTSPDLANFPSSNLIPSLMGELQDDHSHLPWGFSADQSPHHVITPGNDQRQTQFYIQEFPNQKAEHAQAAQQLNQTRPRHYAFQHHKPEDFISHA